MDSSDDDDDIPGLESVSSSEYVEDSESESDDVSDDVPPGIPQWVDPLKPNYQVAKKWLEQEPAVIDKHVEVIVIHLLSPFLYGHAHQSDCWLKWCQEAGLLISDVDYNTGCLGEVERDAVDVLDMAVIFCKTVCMQPEEPPDVLAWLLELADDIRPILSLKAVVKHAKRCRFFQEMLSSVTSSTPNRIGGMTNTEIKRENFVEIGCLYVINQTAEHVQKFIKSEHDLCLDYEEQILTHEKSGEMLRKKGDELFNAGKSQDAIEIYSTAIVCGPYNYQLYTKRAYAHFELQQYKYALSDGLRAIYLRPDCSKGYVRYIQSLNASGDDERGQEMKRIYHDKFTGLKEREQLRIALDHLFVMEKKKIEPTEEDRVLNEKLVGLCKQASEAYLRGNNDEALFYYNDALSVSFKNKGWQHCLVHSDCLWFQISLHFAYGLSLLKKGTAQCAHDALDQFSTILNKFSFVTFPPASWGMGMSLIQLHCHGDALEHIQKGIDRLSAYRLPGKVSWPGTDEVILECLAQNIKLKLHQLQMQCQPLTISDAVCRYGNCLQYYSSTAIQKDCHDYKGHILMQCTESCSISYHASCWRRFKSEGMISTEKDFLMTICPTPDCHGSISTISVYNNKGKVQNHFEAPAESLVMSKTDTPTVMCFKEGRRSSRSKQGERSRRKERSSGIDESSKEVDLKAMEEGKKDEEDEMLKDCRKAEDGILINKQQSNNREGDSLKSKIKKKKAKQTDPTSSVAKQHWRDLFTLPERKGLLSEATCGVVSEEHVENTSFLPPDHLREAIEDFEQSEVPSIGLVPQQLTTAIPTDPPTTADISTSENLEFVFSYFAEIFKTHGPLLPTDTRLTDSLTFLPEEKTRLIESFGGLKTFLLGSPLFVLKEDTICLVENAPVTSLSLDSKCKELSKDATMDGDRSGTINDDLRVTNCEEPARETSSPVSFRMLSAMDSPNTYHKARVTQPKLANKHGACFVGTTKLSSIGSKEKQKSQQHTQKNSSSLRLADDILDGSSFGSEHSPKTSTRVSNEGDILGQFFEQAVVVGSPVVTNDSNRNLKGIAEGFDVRVSVSVQTDVPLVTDKWVMTDPLPPVENFREGYEKVSKEKNDLQVKLERSEDQRFKMQRDHKRDVEKLKRKYLNEAKEEAAGRIKDLEEQVAEARSKGLSDKREQAEQLRSVKGEIKSLTEKIDKMKREASKKEKRHATNVTQHQREIECLQSENSRVEERLLTQRESAKKDRNRAVLAEVELLSLRRETVLKPGEQRLREVDNVCASIPQGNDFHREWMAYRDKLKTALDCFQNAMDDQVRQVKSGCELLALDKVPNPTVPIPPQLAAFRMPMLRPRFIPMMPVRGPIPSGSHLPDPTSFKGSAPPIVNGPIPPTMRVMHAAQPQPVASNSVTNTTSSVIKESSGGASLALDLEIGANGSGKKSSFERIMEKLAPLYPDYARDDFKGVLREVRRNNNNTLSGLSLDSIASQVKSIIDAKTKTKNRGKQGKGKTAHLATRLQPKRLPPVALAPPPLISSTDYDDEGSCIICYEEMKDSDSSRLNCGHHFHTDCIRSWFKEQSTCPTCRNHSLLPEEYPLL